MESQTKQNHKEEAQVNPSFHQELYHLAGYQKKLIHNKYHEPPALYALSLYNM